MSYYLEFTKEDVSDLIKKLMKYEGKVNTPSSIQKRVSFLLTFTPKYPALAEKYLDELKVRFEEIAEWKDPSVKKSMWFQFYIVQILLCMAKKDSNLMIEISK